jgi:hypothetical protein
VSGGLKSSLRLTCNRSGVRCAGPNTMSILEAVQMHNFAEVEQLVGQDPGLLNATDDHGWSPLMWASQDGRVCMVRFLLDKGAPINHRSICGGTALFFACREGHLPVVRLLVERGADAGVARVEGSTALMIASEGGHLEAVRVLLGHPSGKITIDHRDREGRTALWRACSSGRGGVVRALLETGADPTIADNEGTTPMAVAQQDAFPYTVVAEGRRACVAALEVRFLSLSCPFPLSAPALWICWLKYGVLSLMVARRQQAERAYLLCWKVRQVADHQGSGAVAMAVPWGAAGGWAVRGGRGAWRRPRRADRQYRGVRRPHQCAQVRKEAPGLGAAGVVPYMWTLL